VAGDFYKQLIIDLPLQDVSADRCEKEGWAVRVRKLGK
jgi:hypothetical protein